MSKRTSDNAPAEGTELSDANLANVKGGAGAMPGSLSSNEPKSMFNEGALDVAYAPFKATPKTK